VVPESALSVGDVGRARTEREYRRRKDTAVLAIVFADIADSTALLEDLGEDRYDELREAHNHRVRGVVEQDDAGCVVQFYGDEALAVFSEPSTAVERSLRLVKATQDEHAFRLRVGIDVGQVSRNSNGGTVLEVFGRHVNRAARIQARAEPGHVLTSYSVYDFAVGWLRSAGVAGPGHSQRLP
jgi:class 3 adenylate cyclase